jgi:uncharacterized protein (TIGR03067 family)
MPSQIRASMLAFAVCATLCVAQEKVHKKPDREAIIGEWKVAHFEEQGEVEPPGKLKSMTYVFSDGKAAIKLDGKIVVEFTMKLDPTKEPKHLDFEHPKEHSIGIYKLDGDKLTICARAFIDKGDRPKEFKTGKGSRLMLIELDRVKK